MIRLEHLTIGYGSKVLVNDASATFANATLTALIGRNGSGKSTLLRAIAGLGALNCGKTVIDGSESFRSPADRAKALAFVNTQRVRITNMRCRDVVGLGRAPHTDWIGHLTSRDKAIVDESLARVGMVEYADRTLDTMSDGECQRVMIARALAQDTPNILLDEPTSFLDLPNRYQLMALLHDLAHKYDKCIILSTHELDIALRTTDAIALIHNRELQQLPSAAAATADCVAAAFNLPGLRG